MPGRRVPSAAPSPPSALPDATSVDGRSTRWADHREARRAEFVRVARRTVHHHGPDVSMEEIAAAAGTSKSIVYRYFTDKTGLQIAVAELVVRQIRDALEAVLHHVSTPREAVRAMVAVYLEMIESSPHVYAFVTRDGSVESGGPLGHFLDAVTALVAAPFARALTEEAADDEEQRAAALADAWGAGAVGFVRGAGEWWLAHRGEPGTPDRETLTAQVAAWLWAGPVGLLAREHPRSTTTPTTAPAHPAAQHPTGGDEAAPTPREQR
ncbi:transcriptional regulator, TetR family [Cellulomonas flavigena DSM 20109]|uniref:Transcriptional regulator, TetR family n=1 Tax=Cellulomonas flavigena (strain ATCC 482 / DSM 20109 / BCRC 11376 / JCM 18109 / NBRC 3775 / NCIMB 8073 / NRS 134) TaxID=446466 RepID=D5UKF8_CELFN|nr:transcriptional regulator, TetR family [Cellulomonas flavigena DSM 20109]